MAVSVVVAWYHSEKKWPETLKGLEDNEEAIQEIILTCDHEEPVTDEVIETLEEFGRPYKVLYQPHQGFGIGRIVNRAVIEARGPLILKLDDDITLLPGTISMLQFYARRGLVVRCRLHDMNSRRTEVPVELAKDGFFTLYRGGMMMFYREDFLAMGGMNEEMIERGLNDYEFGVRWARRFGIPGIRLIGDAYHRDNMNQSPVPMEDGVNVRLFKKALSELFDVDISKLCWIAKSKMSKL